MGATVFNNARVMSMKLTTGKVVYLWDENTHCIKDGPKAASWCAMKFGDQKAMLDRIYGLATNIPGGMLKVRGKTPVTFVQDMLAALRSPAHFQHEVVSLGNTKRDFYSAITDANRAQAVAKLLTLGRQDLADRIEKSKEDGGEGSIKLDVHKDFDVLNALVNDFRFQDGSWGEARGIPVWQVFPSIWKGGSGFEGASEPIAAHSPATKPVLSVYRSKIDLRYKGSRDPEFLHVMTIDGCVEFVGRNGYEQDVALIKVSADKHIREGVFFIKAAFNAYAKAQQAVADLPEDVEFRFHSPGASSWYRESFDAIAKVFNGEVCDDFTVTHERLASLSEEHRDALRVLVDSSRHGCCVIEVKLKAACVQPTLL